MADIAESKADIWIGAGLLAFCGFASWRTLYVKQGFSATAAGPSFVPWLMIGGIAALSLVLIARALMREADPDARVLMPGRRTLAAMGAFAVLMVGYAAAFMPLGYLPSTIVTFILGLLLLGERNWLIVILFPVAMTGAVYFGFTELLSVWLP